MYILMLSIHGLIRGHEPELGRDADTGGQVLYVLELARALGRHPAVERVDLFTRLIDDDAVGPEYRQPEEILGPNARLLRVPFGPRRYVRKESLWPYLDQLVDRCLTRLRAEERLPDLIHSHYADAGYVGQQLSLLLGIPQVHTGHSLGRCKEARLLAAGRKQAALERQFNFARRIKAEEDVLEHAALVVTSTGQEAQEQYGMYQNHDPARTLVVPPGTDTSRFSPPKRGQPLDPAVQAMIDRFLHEPDKPLILTICRPDPRKNIRRLVTAYGEDRELQARANLAVVAGNRDDIREMPAAEQAVYQDLLLDMDRYDLYGRLAIPKNHSPDHVPALYRLAQKRRGVFVNAALTEPFGLTLIEAAASGLPVVSTNDGGPKDILANCDCGLLIDTLDPKAIAAALNEVLSDRARWRRWSRSAVAGVRRHYTWDAHVTTYLKALSRLLRRGRKRRRRDLATLAARPVWPIARHVLMSDIDNTLLGPGLDQLVRWLQRHRGRVAFGVASGRTLESALQVLREWDVPIPDVLVTAVGTEITYGARLTRDSGWTHHIRWQWRRDALEHALSRLPGLALQPRDAQREFKLSYLADPAKLPPLEEIRGLLHQLRLQAQLIYSHEAYLDVLPVRASKGKAIRYLAYKWGLPLRAFLVAGDSGNDTEMLVGDTLGVVVGNYSPEMESLRGVEQVYFAQGAGPLGILEGIGRYEFAGERRTMPRETRGAAQAGARR